MNRNQPAPQSGRSFPPKPRPPRWADRLLEWFVAPHLVEYVQGDLHELFHKRVVQVGPGPARREYVGAVLHCLTPFFAKRQGVNPGRATPGRASSLSASHHPYPHSASMAMVRNYLKIAGRNLLNQKSYSLINLFGLATGLAVALLIIQYVRFEWSYEHANPLANRIVRLTMDYMNGGTLTTQDTETYPPIGPAVSREVKEVVSYTRAYPVGEPSVTVQANDHYYIVGKVLAVDSTFFALFNYPLLRGSMNGVFTRPRQAVLTKTTALTYFNTLDVVGKTLKIPRPEKSLLLQIVGVVADPPANTHLKFDLLLSYPTMLSDFGEREDNWNGNNTLTYVLLSPQATYDGFTRSLAAFSQRLLADKKMTNKRVVGQPIADIHLHSHKNFETEPNGEARSVYFLLGVACLILLSALVNYVNLTTAKSLDRAREIGLRKVVGSTQTQIRTQIFLETVLVNLLAGVLAVGLVAGLQHLFIRVAGLPESFTVVGDTFFWQSMGVFLGLSIILSGAYPAFVLSSFDPVKVLKGNFSRSAQGSLLRKSLVVFQFTVTIVLLVQTVVVYRQLTFLRQQNLGLSLDRTLVVKAPVGSQAQQDYGRFRQMLLSQAQVKAVSVSSTVPGLGSTQMGTTTGINLSDAVQKTAYNYYLTSIDTSYIELMGIRLLAGKNFDATTRPAFPDTTDRQFIVNQEALRLWGIATPQAAVGRRVDFWGHQATIRGVVENYHYESPKAAYIPIIHMYSPSFEAFASVKFVGGTPADQLATLKRIYEANFPYSPFSYFFMDSEYDKQYKADDRFEQVFGSLTGLAILISCLGLFGLATFTVAKRTKEIGIRKVIGASTTNLLLLLSQEFIRTVLISLLIGLPITYVMVKNWLTHYAVQIELNWWLFAGPAGLVLLLVLISIGSKTVATALMNPVNSLRSE